MSTQYPSQAQAPVRSIRGSSEGIKRILNITLSLLVILIPLVLGWRFLKNNFFTEPGTITIVGEGRVLAQSQLARFTVSWISSGNTPSEALQNERSVFNKIVGVLRTNGVQNEDIQVAYARVVPPAAAGGGYQAVNALDTELRGVAKLNEVVSSLYNNGAASVANIVLSTDNQEELEEQAIEAAIKDAKNKAKKTAKASNKRLGRLVSLTSGATGNVSALTSQVGTTQPQAGFSSEMEAGGEMFVQDLGPGQIEVVRRVSVVYEVR